MEFYSSLQFAYSSDNSYHYLIKDYQKNRSKWKATEKGKNYTILKDTAKKHSDGTPIQQLFYLESVIGLLTEAKEEVLIFSSQDE